MCCMQLNELVYLTIEWYRALRDGKEVSATPEFDEAKLMEEINGVEKRKVRVVRRGVVRRVCCLWDHVVVERRPAYTSIPVH